MLARLVVLSATLFVCSCGGGDAESSGSGADAAANGQTAANDGSASGSSVSTPLPTTPISASDAMGRTPPSVKETDPCPFLSDETARAAATTEYVLTRRRVSNAECVWNYNIGFQVSARVEPIASSRPFSDHAYNMDVPAVLQSMSSPGQNAVVLADTAFKGAPRPYAFGFEQRDQRIVIYITGMRTSEAQLQAAAEEIATRLPNAPTIEPQIREETGAFDPCATWTEASLRTLFNQPDSAVVGLAPSRTSCTYTIYFPRPSQNVVTVGLYIGEAQPDIIASLKGEGWSEVSGATVPTVSLTTTDQFGISVQMRGVMHGADVLASVSDKDGGKDAMVDALFANLKARVVP